MGLSGVLGRTNKKINSISKAYTSVHSFSDALLKEPCDIHNPTLQLAAPYDTYTYMEFKGNYYYVDSVTSFPNGIIEVSAHLDPLATYQADIKAANAFCVYADSANHNDYIDDLRFQPEKQNTDASATSVDLFSTTINAANGSVVVRVMEAYTAGHQGIGTYVMSGTEFGSCLRDISGYFDQWIPSQAGVDVMACLWDLLQLMGKIWGSLAGTGSWADNLLSAVWVPIAYADMPGSPASQICFGSIPCPVTAKKVGNPSMVQKHSTPISLNWSGNSGTYPFLKNPRFSCFQLIAPGFYTEINTSSLKNQSQVTLYTTLNPCTGQWSGMVCEGGYATQRLAMFGGCMGVDLGQFIGQSVPIENQGPIIGFRIAEDILTYGASESGSVSGISGLFKPSGIVTGCSSGSANSDATTMYLGDAADFGKLSIVPIQYEPKNILSYDSYCAEYGYPCNDYLNLGSISGFCQCAGASVSCSGTQKDIQYINSICNSGIIIEN